MRHHARRIYLYVGHVGILFPFFAPLCHAASVCGPGDHWVDACTADTVTLQVRMEFGLDTNLDNLTDVEAGFDGMMTVKRGNPFASDPIAYPSHLDRMNSQILSMVLTGTGGYVAGWTFRAGADQGLSATTGYIQESAGPAVAENRYNMVFNIDGTPYGTLHHAGSFFFSADITGFPQISADYKHLGTPFGTHFALLDQNGATVLNMTDLFNTDYYSIGRPHFVVTQVVPVPGAALLFGSGIVSMFLAVWRRARLR